MAGAILSSFRRKSTMNAFIKAIKALDVEKVESLIPKWAGYEEQTGKNALHYLGGVKVGDDKTRAEKSLLILQTLLKNGMDMNSIHRIEEECDFFPATPLWYAYAKGRNKKLYRWLLESGAKPDNCMFAIAWNDDVEAAEMFQKHGAKIQDPSGKDTPFTAAFYWKRFRVVEWFLQKGADVNTRDEEGNTCLHLAVRKKYDPEAVQLLLRYGADVDLKNNEGISPKAMAETNRQRKFLTLFKSANDSLPKFDS